jgi:Tfp pilus assembly protein PilO
VIELKELSAFIGPITLIIQGLLVWGLWSLRSSFVSRREFEASNEAMQKKLIEEVRQSHLAAEAVSTKVDRFEVRLETMPSQKEVHDLTVSVEKLSGKVGAAVERLEAADRNQDRMERVLNRVEDYLLNGGSK